MQSRTSSHWNTRRLGLAVLAAGSLSLAAVAGGCNNAGEGALSGATLGALAGMGLGSLTGDMGKGAAAGAIIGGVGGAVIGDQNIRNSRRSNNNEW
ncbi:MAG: glycine zipper domain-containing protein [Phycisphaerales bacterium JB041]